MHKVFTPKFSPREQSTTPDKISSLLQTAALAIMILTVGTLPLSLLFYQYVNLGFSKTMLVLTGSLVALLCIGLSVLRSGIVRVSLSVPILALFAIAGVTGVSALVSGDVADAVRGDALGIHTAGFVLLVALVAAMATFFKRSQVLTLRFFQLLLASVVVLAIFHLGRIVFGVEFLSFGVFSSELFSPLGNWNDLAILFGISIVLSLIALEQMPLSSAGRLVLTAIIALGLALLAIVNFVYVWVVVGIISLIFLMYGLVKDRWQPQAVTQNGTSVLGLALNAIVFIVATMFVLGGSVFGGWIAEKTNISYVEVRPSFSATVDIGRDVYANNAFTGIGPNRFADAWRLYKDRSINETVFWNTDFRAGSGYIVTWFVTTGIFGMMAWITFLVSYAILGYRLLIQSPANQRFWYFIGSASFITSALIWGMSVVYVPGVALLLLAAFMTGLTVAASSVLLSARYERTFNLSDRKTGFLLIAIVLVLMIGAIGVFYETGRQYASVYLFSKSLTDTDLNRQEVLAGINEAYRLYPNDAYLRQAGRIETNTIVQLAQIAEPNEEQVAQFQTSVANAVGSLQQATALDATQPINWGFLGQLLFVIATSDSASREVALQQASEAVAVAKQFDPLNPEYALLEAQIAVQNGDVTAARAAAEEAVRLKRNFTSALNFIAQLDISAGNTEAAVESVRAMIQLEPNNPARYYQLGILQSSLGNTTGVVSAMEAAIARDSEHANARYILALAYVDLGRPEDAVAQLEIVRDLNPDNAGVQSLIEQIEAGDVSATTTTDTAVSDPSQVEVSSDGVTTTSVSPDTDLVVPVNPVLDAGGTNEDSEPAVPETAPEEPATDSTQ